MASETTFDHWKVVFSWGKMRKSRFSQNPLNPRFWAFGFSIYTSSSSNFKKDPPRNIFFVALHVPASSGLLTLHCEFLTKNNLSYQRHSITQSKIFSATVHRLFRSVGTSFRASGFLPSTLLVTRYQNMNRMISVQSRENWFNAHPSFHTLSLFCTHFFRQINSKIGTCNSSNWPGQYKLSPISSSFLILQA